MTSSFQKNKTTLSAIIITYNEEKNLKECLRTLQICDEVVIVDRGSSDSTQAVASEFNARFYSVPEWAGFGIQKQRCLELASSDWILSIDADERVSKNLQHEIICAINSEKYVGFYIKRQNFFLGKHLKFGGWSDEFIVRLSQRSNSNFEQSPVHEKLLVNGSVGTLSSPILHFSYQDFDDIFEKSKRYALATGRKKKQLPTWAGGQIGLIHSVAVFLLRFFLKLGFLDGSHGLLAAVMKSQEVFWRHVARTLPNK